MAGWPILTVVLLASALLLIWLARRRRHRSGLPRGRVILSDMGRWDRLERPLFSNELLVTGKPDYLVEDGAHIIPVEVKSGRGPDHPYPSHVMQLAAYCALVEECYGRRPAHGIIKYADRMFEVDYSTDLEDELLASIGRMRGNLATGGARRSHDDPRRCRSCGYGDECDQRLV